MSNKDKTNFIVLSGPRTGSSAFRLWLNNHELIRCHDEVLLKKIDTPDAIRHYMREHFHEVDFDEENISFANTPELNQLLNLYLKSLYTNPEHSGPWVHFDKRRVKYIKNKNFYHEQAVGFKCMYYLLDNPFITQWLRRGEVKILHLSRENKLKQYISYLVAKDTNLYHSEEEGITTKINVKTESLIDMLNRLEDGTEKIHNYFNGENYTRISYEDFLKNKKILCKEVTDFLGVDNVEMKPPLIKKTNSDRIKDIVKNYDEMAEVLNGSKFQNML